MIEMRKADQRGVANLGWLRSFHTFSFASYWDPSRLDFLTCWSLTMIV